MIDETKKPALLLECEVAELLRCSKSTVFRLRRKGELSFISGRPVKIFEDSVYAYAERQKRSGKFQPEPGSPEAARAEDEKIAALARRVSLIRRLRRQASSS